MNAIEQNSCKITSGNPVVHNSSFPEIAGDFIEMSIPAGKAGSLTTRTSNSVGTLTLATGHGVITGDTINIWWEGGIRLEVTVGTVSGNSVPISGGSSNSLPVLNTAIVVTLDSVSQVFQNDAALLGRFYVQWAAANINATADLHVVFSSAAPAINVLLHNTEVVDLINDRETEEWQQFLDETLQGDFLQKVTILNTTTNAGTFPAALLAV